MRHLQGESRHQASLLPELLDDFVTADHPIRVIDAYVDSLDISALGFDKALTKDTGRKPYHPGDLLKLYVYGYLNQVRTSRRLESECQRNVEVMWLMKRLRPDFKTIADFRKDNRSALGAACRSFIEFCRQAKLLTGTLVAIDGSKFKAAASIDQALTRKQLERDRVNLEHQVQRYLARLDEADVEERCVGLERVRVEATLDRLKEKTQCLERREQAMDAGGRNEDCATESQARLMRSGREGMVLGYNVQSAVDADSGLIVHHQVTDEPGDTRLLQPMAEQTKAKLGVDTLEVLADKGYSNGEQLAACEQQGITATVPRRIIPNSNMQCYQKSDFNYDASEDCYRCPAGQILSYSGDDKRRKLHLYKRTGCSQCPLQPKCTLANTRMVTRHFHEASFARSQARLHRDPSLMKRRMGIVERPFAILKQAMGLRRFVCRGLEGASSEMAIGVLGYNLKQMIRRHSVAGMMALLS